MSSAPSSIPIIDLSLAHNPITKPAFLSDLRNVLINAGFLYLANTNSIVDEKLVEEVKTYLPRFFGLPQSVKDSILMENSPHFMGYNRLGSELTKGKTDYREQFDFATPHVSRWKEGDPEYYNLWGPSQYPDDQFLLGFQQTLETYLSQMWALVKELIQLAAEALGLSRDAFAKFFDTDDRMQCFGKLVRYPISEPVSGNQQGVGPHFDGGFLTILLQASDHPGLQAQSLTGEWIDVPPIPGTFVVNSGRALEFVTGGVIRATSHRVISPTPSSKLLGPRYSIPFFQSIDMNARLTSSEYRIEFPDEIIRLKEERGKLVDTDAVNFPEFASEPSGRVVLMGRIRSHPDVGERHYPVLFNKLFPSGIPRHFNTSSTIGDRTATGA